MSALLTELRRRDIALWRDGDNLRFNAPAGALTPELREELTSHKTELLAELADAPRPRTDPAVEIPLSFSQERLWVVDQMDPGLATYNCDLCWRISGPLDVPALERSLAEIARRHEVLRIRIERGAGGGPVQIVQPPAARALPVVGAAVAQLPQLAAEAAERPFDLARGPLWRAVLARFADEDHALFLTWHHLVFDAWSESVFTRELTALYTAYREGEPSPLPELAIQFGDFALWQRAADFQAQLAYWRTRLAGDRPPLALPADRPRPARQTFRGATLDRNLSPDIAADLRRLAREEGATIFMLLLAAFKALLARYTGESDLCIGSPIAQRSCVDTEPLIGFFLNMLALRTDLAGDPTFRELLRRVRTTVLDGFENQDAPFEKVVEALHPARVLSHHPLFQAAFVCATENEAPPALPGLRIERLAVPVTTSKFDLMLFATESADGLRLKMEYSTDLFDAATIARMLTSFELLLKGVVAQSATPLSRLPILDAVERERIVVAWNGTALAFPQDATIHSLFEQCAARNPSAVAVVDGERRISYGELNGRANTIAHRLRALGVQRETFVGVCMTRSAHLLAALLGILKAGGAYVPMDPNYPADRLALMLADSRAPVVLCDAATATLQTSARWERVDGEERNDFPNPESNSEPRDLAYLIYTSGSTGRPKGVALEHRNAVAFIHWARQAFAPEELAGVLASTSICFDLSIFEIFVPLASGGTVIVAENVLALPDLRAANEVTLVNTVPSAMTELLRAHGLPPGVRTVNLAGEALPENLVAALHRTGTVRRVCDLYGPTETTTYSTFTDRKPDLPPTIGRPIANTQIYVLDALLQPVPIGVAGEIYIGGAGVARGYWEQPALTAERFLASPFIEGERIYKTGDLARWRSDGNLVYLGRADHQVKVRGFRIEPGEIEAAMRLVSGVRDARAVYRESGSGIGQIVSYFVSEGIGAEQLRATLARTLPAHLVPTAFVSLKAIPLTPNGKLDRSALPLPEETAAPSSTAPQTPLEHEVIALWSEVLGRNSIGIHDDFFLIGGHSLLAIRLLGKVREKFGVDLPVRRLFETPTVSGIAEFITAQRTAPPPAKPLHSLISIQRGDERKRPFFLVPGGWGGEMEFLVYGMLKHHMGADLPICGLRARGSDGTAAPHENVPEMVTDYVEEIRTRQPHGPYLLGGECVGGVIAYEMARRLESLGEKVALLVLLDTGRPTREALRRFCANERREERERLWEARVRQPVRGHFEKLSRLTLAEKMKYIWERANRSRSWPGATEAAQHADHERKLAHHYPKLLLAYPIGAYGGKVTLLIPEESHRRFGNQGWNRTATGGLDVHLLPGDHVSYIRDHAATAAARLREIIDRANVAAASPPRGGSDRAAGTPQLRT